MQATLRCASVLALAFVLGVAGDARADFLFPDLIGSAPALDEAGVNRQVGRKGILFEFNYTNDSFVEIAGGFPMDLSAAVVQLTVGANAPIACAAGSNPTPGQCRFRSADGITPDGVEEFVEVLFNGDFPANTQIQVSVSGAVSATLVAQDGGSPNTLSFNTGNAPVRTMASVELVFDRSGSMSLPAVPGGGTSRMNALKSASTIFFGLLGDYAMLGDKVGAVSFNQTAVPFDPTPGGTNLEPAHEPGSLTSVAGHIGALTPGGATSIGDGLAQANAQGFAIDPSPNPRQFVLLFSDGEQNTAPNAAVMGGSVQVGGSPYPAGIRVCPITAGRMTAPGFMLQQDIGVAACDGQNAHILNTSETFANADLETFFTQALTDVLLGDKLEMVRDRTGRISHGQEVRERFLANPEDVALTVVLTDVGGSRGQGSSRSFVLPFDLIAPDGRAVDLTGRLRFSPGKSWVTLPLPAKRGSSAIETAGVWQVVLKGGKMDTKSLDYHLMILLDNATLASTFSIPKPDPGLGEPIPLRVRLEEGGRAVPNARVKATWVGPKNGAGNLLSKPFDSDGSTADPLGPDGGPNAAAIAKLQRMAADPQFAHLFGVGSPSSLTLVDDGSAANGDEKANDGVYSALFRGADTEGHYHFVFDVSASARGNGRYQRTRKQTVFARPKPDAASTPVQVKTQTVTTGSQTLQAVQLVITPRDARGNLIGPGYLGGGLRIEIKGAEPHRPLIDRLDGSYMIEYLLPAKKDPAVLIEVLGRPLIKATLSQLQKRKIDYRPYRREPDEERKKKPRRPERPSLRGGGR